ncbi:MAG TPA: adenylate/guanylate cyclase domain-containing protein [Ramlibacter sp.]|uniref:adenylate/guanylate cyclase domain-containing protein n=1 Tax=Ramlibacter sp. TaxID=1917967 RepID=UPI002ED115A8
MDPIPSDDRLRKRHRFRVEVGTLIVGVVAAQALLLVVLGFWGAQRLLHDAGRAGHQSEHTRLQTEVKAFMEEATTAVRTLAVSPGQGSSARAEQRSAELIWALLAESPVLDNLYFAHHDGSLVGMQRHPAPLLRRIHREGAGLREVLEHKPQLERHDLRPAQRFATSHVETHPTRFDVHEMPWFTEATSSMQTHWTAVHALPLSGDLGITFSAPDALEDAQGRLDGVAAGDISLRHLEAVVETFSHAGAGESAIVTADRLVLARSDDHGAIRTLARPPAGDILEAALAADAAQGREGALLPFRGQDFLVRASDIPGTPWKLVSWVPEDALTSGLRRSLAQAGALLLLCLAVALLLSLWLSRRVTGPIEVLAGVARRIGRLDLAGLPGVDSPVEEIHRLDEALGDSARSLRALRKFVPADVVGELVRQGRTLEPSGEHVDLTVMFTDVQGFTGIAAEVPPQRLVPQLTEYFSAAAEVLVRHGGTIDKYIGDGMMVLWGVPRPEPDAAYRATLAALELQEVLEARNAEWAAQGLPQLHTRIGLHCGPAVAGVLGSAERLSFTAYGDTVNVASRIEAMNKELGTRILASDAVAAALHGRIALRPHGPVELRGRPGTWTLHEVVGPIDPQADAGRDRRQDRPTAAY